MWTWLKHAGPWLWKGFKAALKWLLAHPAGGLAIAAATAGAGALIQIQYADVPFVNALGAGMQYTGAVIGAIALNGLWWELGTEIIEEVILPVVTKAVAPYTNWVWDWIIAPTAFPGFYLPR